MCSRATIGPRCINKVEMATNQGFKSFICKKEHLDYEFFHYLLSIYIPYFKKLASGSTFLEISKRDVENTKVFIPQDINEQVAISSIIGNMDNAIELLEEETRALRQQKKGLMQLLLTGKVRVKA
ncbi:restriction endonuclease subunit S [Bacillus tamaricis]|uniref:Restriction endonuclease subunit S n=2 Tax=Evansella tamaricis TaxID=2069301 RepID=A0ABS6JB29_9BACI|nr:restriction endonuclease subunit S [Evansella tamaricis]MBU9710884.1 restriction endonuclease subunit S [Evansella tamaricis]